MTQYRADFNELATSCRKWFSLYEEGLQQMLLVEVFKSDSENVVKFFFGAKRGSIQISEITDASVVVSYLEKEFCRPNAEAIAAKIIKMIENI